MMATERKKHYRLYWVALKGLGFRVHGFRGLGFRV